MKMHSTQRQSQTCAFRKHSIEAVQQSRMGGALNDMNERLSSTPNQTRIDHW
jgi:hypothetical protein